MGLDMYLYQDDHCNEPEEFYEDVNTEELAYWRKINAVHAFFVSVGKELDPGVLYRITREDLEDLLDLIKDILSSSEEDKIYTASNKLPTTSGFFFGSLEYDSYYFENLERVQIDIEYVLEENQDETFLYYASY